MTIITVLDVYGGIKSIEVPSTAAEVIQELVLDKWVKDWKHGEFYPLHRILRIKEGEDD